MNKELIDMCCVQAFKRHLILSKDARVKLENNPEEYLYDFRQATEADFEDGFLSGIVPRDDGNEYAENAYVNVRETFHSMVELISSFQCKLNQGESLDMGM